MLVLSLSSNITWVDMVGPFGKRLRINRCEMPKRLDESVTIAFEGEAIGRMVKLKEGRGRHAPMDLAHDRIGFEMPACWRIIRSNLKPRWEARGPEKSREAEAVPAVCAAGVRQFPDGVVDPAEDERDVFLPGQRTVRGDGGGDHSPLKARVARATSRGPGAGGGGR